MTDFLPDVDCNKTPSIIAFALADIPISVSLQDWKMLTNDSFLNSLMFPVRIDDIVMLCVSLERTFGGGGVDQEDLSIDCEWCLPCYSIRVGLSLAKKKSKPSMKTEEEGLCVLRLCVCMYLSVCDGPVLFLGYVAQTVPSSVSIPNIPY